MTRTTQEAAPMETQTTVRLPKSLTDQMTVVAKKHHRSMKGEIMWVLEKHLEEHKHVLEAAKQQAAA
jgi:plasmid stability protein